MNKKTNRYTLLLDDETERALALLRYSKVNVPDLLRAFITQEGAKLSAPVTTVTTITTQVIAQEPK